MTLKDTQATPVIEDIHYYDGYYNEEDQVAEGGAHANLTLYLVELLRWYYRVAGWYVSINAYVFQPPSRRENPVAPDVAVFKAVVPEAPNFDLDSWNMALPNRPAPAVVFEISFEKTWPDDLGKKVDFYRRMGVREYFAYDPHIPRLWTKQNERIKGWRYDEDGTTHPISPNEHGWLWSQELDSWLVSDRAFLRLYDIDGNRRLNETEEDKLARQEATKQAQAASRAREAERKAKEEAQAAQEAERRAKEEAQAQLEALKNILRAQGIDPDKFIDKREN